MQGEGSPLLEDQVSSSEGSIRVWKGKTDSLVPIKSHSALVSPCRPKGKEKVLRHSTIGQNNVLCSAHHIPTQAKCLWDFFPPNFKAFWLKYTRRALTAQAASVLLWRVSMAAVYSPSIYFKAGMKQTWQMVFKKNQRGSSWNTSFKIKFCFFFFFFPSSWNDFSEHLMSDFNTSTFSSMKQAHSFGDFCSFVLFLWVSFSDRT